MAHAVVCDSIDAAAPVMGVVRGAPARLSLGSRRASAISHYPVPALDVPVLELLRGTVAYRIGPDRIHAAEFADAPWPVAWVAYWYRRHTWCSPTSACPCWEAYVKGDRDHLAGDGVAVVAYMDGLVGVHDLTHGERYRSFNWSDIAQRMPRLTWEECAMLREAALRQELEFVGPAGTIRMPDRASVAVWRAVDIARATESRHP